MYYFGDTTNDYGTLVNNYFYIRYDSSNNIFDYMSFNSVKPNYLTSNSLSSYAQKTYVDNKPTTYAGYDASKTQVLKNINGTLTWVDE